MFHSLFFPVFAKFHHRVCEILGNTPYTVEDEKYLRMSGKGKGGYIPKALSLLNIVYCVVISFHMKYSSHLEQDDKLLGMPFYLCYISVTISGLKWAFDIGGIQFMNSMMMFEREGLDEDIKKDLRSSKMVKAMFSLVLICNITGTVFPLVVLLLTLTNPCIPPFTASMWPECGSKTAWYSRGGVWGNVGRVGIALVDAWFCANMVSAGTSANFYILLAVPGVLVTYLKAFKQRLSTSRKIYGSVEILVHMMNDLVRNDILPVFMAVIIWIEILSMYATIMLHQGIPLPTFLIFPLMAVDTVLINVFVYTLDSRIFKESLQILAMRKREIGGTHGKDMKVAVRENRASQPMKLRFGSSFVDPGTPLVIQDFCIQQLVSLILIRNERLERR